MTQRIPSVSAWISVTVIAIAAMAGAAPAQADRSVPYATYQAWRIQAAFDAADRLTRCSATGRYKSGIRFSVIYFVARKSWVLQFYDPSWPQRTGKTPATMRVDDAVVWTGNLAWIKNSAFLALGQSVSGVVRLMKGNRLEVQTPSGRSSFSLKGSRGATTKVVACIKQYAGTITANRGGAFGAPPADASSGPNAGAFGAAPGQPTSTWKLSRSATLQYAIAYLDKRGVPYRILPEGKHIFKNLPVNWMYNSRAWGGMIALRSGRFRGADALNQLLSSHAKVCDVKSALVREKPVTTPNGTTTLRAKGACEATKGAYFAEFSVIEKNGSAAFMIIEMQNRTPATGGPNPSPGARAPKLQEG